MSSKNSTIKNPFYNRIPLQIKFKAPPSTYNLDNPKFGQNKPIIKIQAKSKKGGKNTKHKKTKTKRKTKRKTKKHNKSKRNICNK